MSANLTISFVNNTFMFHPGLSIQQKIFELHIFNRDNPMISQNKFAFSNTCELCLFTFLPKMTIYAVLFHRHMEHLAGGSTVDVTTFSKYFGPPGFTRQMSKDTGLNDRVL